MAVRVARLAVLGAGLIAIAAIVSASLDPTTYFFDRPQGLANWKYPASGVALATIAVALETAVAYAVLVVRRPGRTWMRALIGLAVLAPWGWGVSRSSMFHAPWYVSLHVLWIWSMIGVLALAASVSGLVHTYSRLRERRIPSP